MRQWVVYLSGYAAIRARIAFLMGSDRRAVDDAILVLRETHERVLEEVQVQRNRVAKLRLQLQKYEKRGGGGGGGGGDGGDGGEDGGAPPSPSGGQPPLAITERPAWDSNVVIPKEHPHLRKRGAESPGRGGGGGPR